MIAFLEKHKKICIRLLWAAVALASIKSIFTDTGFDNAYITAMSYRHLQGDGMFQQMWEPHQTSAFFTDFFMWIYHLFVPSYAGVMFYLQIVGTLFFAGIAYLLYRMLKSVTGSGIAQLAVMFFFMFRPKQTPFPDFSNLQVGFSALLLVSLVCFFRNQQKKRYLCLAAVFLCLEILSYPSCLMAYFPVVGILLCRTKEKGKNAGIFTGLCAGMGAAYLGYFAGRIGPRKFFRNLRGIFYSDSHSGEAFVSRWNYFSGLLTAVVWIAVCAALAWILARLVRKLWKKSADPLAVYGLLLFLSEFCLLFLQKRTGLDWTCTFYILPALLMLLGFSVYREMDGQERILWLTGVLLALSSLLATWLLTDLGLITMMSYMVLGGTVSFVALRHRKKQTEIFLMAVCALVVMHRGLVVWGYANKGNVWMVQDVDAIIRSGPSAGIVCDYMTYYQITHDAEDHKMFVMPQDSLLLVGGWLIDPMEFLLTDAGISNYSTIDTPVYNEKLLDYLEYYPEKTPTVVAVSCYYGVMQVPETSWIMEWVNEHYEEAGDGKYWRYYRPRQ